MAQSSTSRQLVDHSPDLRRLEDEGYDLSIFGAETHLLLKVPYVNAQREVMSGMLVSELTTSGDTTAAPKTHVAFFIGATVGDLPRDDQGHELQDLIH